jgi:hypothetical protein
MLSIPSFDNFEIVFSSNMNLGPEEVLSIEHELMPSQAIPHPVAFDKASRAAKAAA